MRQDRSAIRTKGWGRSPGAALLLLLLPLTILAASAAELSPAASADLARADRLYAERSYALALPVYEEWEKAGGLPPERRDDVGLRVAVCLGKTQKWDRARDVTLVYLKAHQGTLWEARALVWLAVLYEKFPDTGYRLGDRLLRERESARQGYGGSVTSVALGDQHARNGLHALEAARVLYQSYRETAGLEEEEIQLNYALISALTGSNQLSRWLRKQDWAPPEDPTWQVDPTEPYSPAWPPPRKHRYLFEQISRLTERLEPGSRRTDLNRVAEAVWFHTYHQQMRWAARKRDEQGRPVGKELIPYPYQERSAVALLQEVIARKPDDSLGDQTSLRLAEWKRENGKPGEVVADLRRFLQ
ncbi:MAG: hypothetical protein FJX77_14420, partial [Armatimonadetes bacterium]|nr:hypothetical protein [Armatimonadota bacterium]